MARSGALPFVPPRPITAQVDRLAAPCRAFHSPPPTAWRRSCTVNARKPVNSCHGTSQGPGAVQYHITPIWVKGRLVTCRRTLSELRYAACWLLCTCVHACRQAGWHKAGLRGRPVSSHVFASIGGLFLPSLRGAWRLGCYRFDYQVRYYHLSQVVNLTAATLMTHGMGSWTMRGWILFLSISTWTAVNLAGTRREGFGHAAQSGQVKLPSREGPTDRPTIWRALRKAGRWAGKV